MKRTVMLASLVAAFVVLFSFVPGGTQTKMSGQVCINISTCADMMKEMAEALKSGKLSPAETQEVISHINQMGRIMKEMSASTEPSLEKQHAQELEQVKEKWQRLRDTKRSMQVKPGH